MLLSSCGKKKYEDYDPKEFYNASGVITHISESSNAGYDIQYHYFINDSTFYKGNAWDVSISLLNQGMGGAIHVKVHREDPELHFYWGEFGADDLTPKKIEIIRKHVERLFFDQKKKEQLERKKRGLEYNNYYLRDSLKN